MPSRHRGSARRPFRHRHAGLLAAVLAAGAALPLPATPAAGRPEVAQRSTAAEAPGELLGAVDFATSARVPEARAHFRRGVAALHSFWYDEAADAFRAAWAAEPGFALAAWGEAMTCNHPIWNQIDLACGRDALRRLGATPGERASRAPTARERAYLAAVETLFFGPDALPAGEGETAAGIERDAAYAAAMADLAAAHPDDLDAAAFHALALQGLVYGGGADGDERLSTLMRSAAILERLFDRAPDHPGVLHYLIHAYDDPAHAPLGLRAAERYAEVAPAAHHALHMPSHIFLQLGRWGDTVHSNEDAWEASVAWQERRGHGIELRDFHSLSWLLYAELQQGRVAAAADTLALARRSLAASGGHPRVAAAVERMEARFRIETGTPPPRAAGAGEAAPPAGAHAADPAHPHATHPESEGSVLYASGLEALAAGDTDGAERLAARLAGGEGAAADRVMAEELAGLVLLARGDTDAGLARLREAARLEAAMPPPSGPPEPPQPADELLGHVLLDLDRPREAAAAFAASLRRTARRPASLLGAARAARALGDPVAAARHYAAAAEVWADADPAHPGVEEAESFLENRPGAE